jgi:flavin reductase (DIM6/NTAB) family NADH-FMN oxidoreductase RutF
MADAAIALECRLSRIVDIGAGPEMTHHCLAEVLHMVIDDRVVSEGKIDLKLLQPIGRLDRGGYCRVDNRFILPRSV